MKKWNSVFTNLAISYLMIVIIIVLLLCSIFYLYFPRNYNEEIKDKNEIILENAANYIESAVFERVKNIYLDLILEKSTNIDIYTKETLQGDYSRVIDIQNLLNIEVASNSDIVSAIHLFYTKPQALISSAHGLIYSEASSKDVLTAMDWIDRMQSNDKSSLWIDARMVPQDIYTGVSSNSGMNPLISYVRSYPFHSTGANCELMIAVDIKETAVSKIIQNSMPANYNNTYIIGQSGKIISASDKGILGSRIDKEAYIQKILSSNTTAESFTAEINHVPYMVSYHKFITNDWKIYSISPINTYYKKSILVQKAVLLICLMALLVGIALSVIFTKASYNPLKRLMGRILDLFDNTSEPERNEYTLIDKAIHTLTSKVSNLEETLRTNKPVIKHNVVLNMLRNSYSAEELAEQLQSLNLSMRHSNVCCMMIDPVSTSLKQLSSKNIQYVLYRLINQLEAITFLESQIIAEELPDKKIVVIVGTDHPEEWILEKISTLILQVGENGIERHFKISIGHWVQEYMELHKSFAEAQILIKYTYFFPELSIIKDTNLLDREGSHAEIPQAVLLKFKEKLQSRNLNDVIVAIDNLTVHMREGIYSADYCHMVILNMVSTYADYLSSVQYKQSVHLKMDLYKQQASIYDINSFREWLIGSVTEFCRHMEQRNEDRNIERIEAVKEYINSHLSEELSQETVASKISISPKYLSKIFKEEMGINYTDYVTKKRQERALELMTRTNMTIEQIAAAVGYDSTAYFIKKFKEINGCTPKNYVRSLIKQA